MNKSSRLLHYLLIITNAVFFIVVCGQLFYRYFVQSNVSIRRIELESDIDISDDSLLDILNITRGSNFFNYQEKIVEEEIGNLAIVGYVSIWKRFPGVLNVKILRRTPFLATLIEQEGINRAALIDAAGVVFQIGGATEADVPLLSGLNFVGVQPGGHIPRIFDPLLKDLSLLKDVNAALYDELSEIKIVFNGESYLFDFYLVAHPFVIRTDGRISEELLTTAVMTMEAMEQVGKRGGILDMRTTGIVYTPSAADGGTTAERRNDGLQLSS